MAAVKIETPPAERDYASPTDATKVCNMLAQMGMSQRGAARELQISERSMRYYCVDGKVAVPRVVMLALERLVDMHRGISK